MVYLLAILDCNELLSRLCCWCWLDRYWLEWSQANCSHVGIRLVATQVKMRLIQFLIWGIFYLIVEWIQKNERERQRLILLNYENRMTESKYEKTHLKLTTLVGNKYSFPFDTCLECQDILPIKVISMEMWLYD